MRVYQRDGFVDRYSGRRLVFPAALRVMSELLPSDFPHQTNWKMDVCHFAYYELSAVVDHVNPRARGGTKDIDNLVTTSTVRNSAKANFTLEELGWKLLDDEELPAEQLLRDRIAWHSSAAPLIISSGGPMNGKSDPQTIHGKIESIGLSGFGPNSGELTLLIGPPGDKEENYYAGIIDECKAPNSIEHGVFAGFISIATMAYSMRASVECTYVQKDKPRITGLVICAQLPGAG